MSSIAVFSQDLPTFTADKAIQHSFLPNGAEYFIIGNNEARGYADFALVQKNYVNEKISKTRLVKLKDFGEVKPYAFLASKGVGYTEDGFVSEREGSTVFSFRNIPVYDGAAPDSTLLILFNIMRETDASQAIIISGDIDVQKITDRMYALSMTVPRLNPSKPFPEYKWSPRTSSEAYILQGRYGNLATLAVSFRESRTPDKYMNTPQPLVTRMFAKEMETIISARVKNDFLSAGLPLADCKFTHIDSRITGGDEIYKFEVLTDTASIMKATSVIGGVLGDLSAHGAGIEEFKDARETLVWSASNSTSLPTNGQYIERCIRSYLFGASLANESVEREFFAKHRLSAEQEQTLFNNFTTALLNSPNSAKLEYAVSGTVASPKEYKETFCAAWNKSKLDTTGKLYPSFGADTLISIQPKKKVKIKTSTTDPVTGGELWTFSNGMNVVFKKTTAIEGFEYALMIRGGYGNIHSLKTGESAFIGDMLSLNEINGMTSGAFLSMLSANGIKMDSEVSASDMRIFGSAPSTKLQLLLKALIALSSDRKMDRGAFEAYVRNERLRLEKERKTLVELAAISDSLLSPTYKYSSFKRADRLNESLPEKADSYFDTQFSKVSDGVFVIVGNLETESLQKTLCRFLGELKTSKTTAVRPRIVYKMSKGWHTYSFDSDFSSLGPEKEAVNLTMAITPPFNMDTYMTFKIVAVAVEKAVAREMAGYGISAKVNATIDIYPTDKLCLNVVLTPCNPSGLPAGIKPAYPNAALDAVRAAVVKASKVGLNSSELKACKTELKARLASELTSPTGLCRASMTRYSLGRDLVSRYGEYVDAVSSQNVIKMLSALESGVRVEVISR